MRKGLTLIEVMVAASVFSFISLSLLLLLRTGIFVRERISGKLSGRQSFHIGMEKMAKELRNVVFFKKKAAGFKGYEEDGEKFLEFYTLNFVYPGRQPRVSKAVYRFNEADKALYKTVRKPFARQPDEEEFEFLGGLESFKLSYFDEDMKVEDKWEMEDKIPQGVKIELSFKEENSKVLVVSNKHIHIYRGSDYD